MYKSYQGRHNHGTLYSVNRVGLASNNSHDQSGPIVIVLSLLLGRLPEFLGFFVSLSPQASSRRKRYVYNVDDPYVFHHPECNRNEQESEDAYHACNRNEQESEDVHHPCNRNEQESEDVHHPCNRNEQESEDVHHACNKNSDLIRLSADAHMHAHNAMRMLIMPCACS